MQAKRVPDLRKKIMIGIGVADIHRTGKRPRCRVEEDIQATQDGKLKFISDYAFHKQSHILCAGDLYDLWFCEHDIVMRTINILKYNQFFACYGQHELPSHDFGQRHRSPLTYHLQHIADNQWVKAHNGCYMYDAFNVGTDGQTNTHVYVYPCSWGQKIPKPLRDDLVSGVHVLLIHDTFFYGNPPFPGAIGNVEELINQKEYRGFDLIVSGDNHKSFTFRTSKTLWVNCGCVFRTDSKERDYKPVLWELYWDAFTQRADAVPIEIPHNVDNVTAKHLEKGKNDKQWESAFVTELSLLSVERKKSFAENVRAIAKKEVEPVRNKLWGFVE